MAAEFDRPVTDISKLNGVLVMFLGITSFVGIVCARFVGKRPILVMTLLLEVAGLAWASQGE
jgi:hypothetical protein